MRKRPVENFFRFPLAKSLEFAYITFSQADMAQLVEHNLAKVGVAGSSPVVRSIACREPVLLESALFISAKWPSGKAEACKAFTPGSNPGFASRPSQGPSAGPFFVSPQARAHLSVLYTEHPSRLGAPLARDSLRSCEPSCRRPQALDQASYAAGFRSLIRRTSVPRASSRRLTSTLSTSMRMSLMPRPRSSLSSGSSSAAISKP